jgi:ribosomal protein S6
MPNQTYDLMLIVSAEAEERRKAEISSEVDALIVKGGGTVSERKDWGNRPLAFEIDHEAVGDYTLIRFEGPGEMIEPMARQLNITDGLLRHRVIKAIKGAPSMVGPSAAVSGVPTPPSAPQAAAPAAPAAPVEDAPAAPVADAPVAEAPVDAPAGDEPAGDA